MDWDYMPILKWKQGEAIALRELTDPQWEDIVPLLELPSIGPIPQGTTFRAVLQPAVQEWAAELKKDAPNGKAIAIDTRYINPLYSRQAQLLDTVCRVLQKLSGCNILPVITEDMAFASDPDITRLADFSDVVLRCQTTKCQSNQLQGLVDNLKALSIRRSRLHLVIDQYSLVGEAAATRFPLITPYLDEAITIGPKSITLAGGSFPFNLIGYKQGIQDIIRVEWKIWEMVAAKRKYADIRYADYAVTNPAPLPQIDPLKVNPSVAIRYAHDGIWRLYKAGGFKKGQKGQYTALCKLLISDPIYCGPNFSGGDLRYKKVASGPATNGTPSSWRCAATNHHIVFTMSQL